MGSHLVTEAGDELVRDHKDEDLCSFDGLGDVRNSDLMRRQQQTQFCKQRRIIENMGRVYKQLKYVWRLNFLLQVNEYMHPVIPT